MLINDFKKDTKKIMIEENTTCVSVAEKLGISKQAVYNMISSKIINESFVKIMDVLGYDIEVTYKKKDQ